MRPEQKSLLSCSIYKNHILIETFLDKKGAVIALSDINLRVDAGQMFGVIGKSGTGKSTLIRCVNLLERLDKGKGQ